MVRAAKVQKETIEVPVFELVEIFQDEANQVCKDQEKANILAILSLVDFIDHYGQDVVIG